MDETLPYSGSTFSDAKSYYGKANDLLSGQDFSGDTAAARVRSRLSGAQRGLEQQLADEYAGRTGAGSGQYRRALGDSRSSYMSNLGGAINDAQTATQQRALDAAKIFGDLGAGSSANAVNEAQVGNWSEQNAINREIGLAQVGATNARTEMERQLGQYSNLTSLLDAFGKYGNTSGSPEFNARLAGILQALFPASVPPTGAVTAITDQPVVGRV